MSENTCTAAPVDAADVLRRAAAGFRTGAIGWGTGHFRHPQLRCRCALGGIAWAADPDNPDGDPRFVGEPGDPRRVVAVDATHVLARYLIDELGAYPAGNVEEYEGRERWELDPIETTGDWNDSDVRTVDDVIAALEAAAVKAPEVSW